MLLLSHIACFLVIALHVYFVVLEMLLWKTKGPRTFGMTPEFAQASSALASNQGLYNGFLVAALIIGYFDADFMLYGLVCVTIAGIWGAVTVSRRIFYVQAMPALAALALLWAAH